MMNTVGHKLLQQKSSKSGELALKCLNIWRLESF